MICLICLNANIFMLCYDIKLNLIPALLHVMYVYFRHVSTLSYSQWYYFPKQNLTYMDPQEINFLRFDCLPFFTVLLYFCAFLTTKRGGQAGNR